MSVELPQSAESDWSKSPAAMISAVILGIAGVAGLVWSVNQEPAPTHSHAEYSTMNLIDDAPARLLIDLNSAQARELEMLPSIGPTIAQRIVDHRNTHGPFNTPQDLDEVHGIGPKTIAKVSNWIAVSER